MEKITKRKNKILFLSFLQFLLVAIIINVQAYTSLSNYKPKYGVTTANVNFRSIASSSGNVIKVLKKGTSVKMLATLDSYYVVELGTNEIGAVAKAYVASSSSAPPGALTYTAITIKNVSVSKSNVNLRRGPGTNFSAITNLSENTNLKAIGYINDWYIVVLENGTVGCVRKDLLNFGKTNTTTPSNTFALSQNEQTILDLINKARVDAGLAKLSIDSNLLKIARLKAIDMVKNSYFSHTSPTYGSPFNMMTSYGISYKVAGENIAGNPSLEKAVLAWLNSETHKQNILSNSYNYIGIGIEKSETYGYIIDVMFIGK